MLYTLVYSNFDVFAFCSCCWLPPWIFSVVRWTCGSYHELCKLDNVIGDLIYHSFRGHGLKMIENVVVKGQIKIGLLHARVNLPQESMEISRDSVIKRVHYRNFTVDCNFVVHQRERKPLRFQNTAQWRSYVTVSGTSVVLFRQLYCSEYMYLSIVCLSSSQQMLELIRYLEGGRRSLVF